MHSYVLIFVFATEAMLDGGRVFLGALVLMVYCIGGRKGRTITRPDGLCIDDGGGGSGGGANHGRSGGCCGMMMAVLIGRKDVRLTEKLRSGSPLFNFDYILGMLRRGGVACVSPTHALLYAIENPRFSRLAGARGGRVGDRRTHQSARSAWWEGYSGSVVYYDSNIIKRVPRTNGVLRGKVHGRWATAALFIVPSRGHQAARVLFLIFGDWQGNGFRKDARNGESQRLR